jgi:hypothetical protein
MSLSRVLIVVRQQGDVDGRGSDELAEALLVKGRVKAALRNERMSVISIVDGAGFQLIDGRWTPRQ